MTEKVYCKDCKHLLELIKDYCEHPKNKGKESMYYDEVEVNFLHPREKNANNNCADFQKRPSLLKRVFGV